MSRIIFVEHRDLSGNLIDATEVTLTSSPDDSPPFGIKRSDGAIVVPPGTPVPRVSLGRYEYVIAGLDNLYDYEFEFKIVDEGAYGGEIEYIQGSIPSIPSPLPPAPSEQKIIFLEHCNQYGDLIDAAEVTLQSPPGVSPEFGIRRTDDKYIAVPAGTAVPRVSLGRYEFNIESLDPMYEYEYYFKSVDVIGDGYGSDGIAYIRGRIEQRTGLYKSGLVGEPVPSGFVPTPVDFDGDGVYDAYGYDTDGDGILDAFDVDMDGYIDSYDVGSQIPVGDDGDSRRDGFARPGSGASYDGPPDGIPDVPAPRGTPATDGTFGGGPGFDGTKGDTPATGGDRTNRDKSLGDGYWDGISYEGLCTLPIGPRGQCYKDKGAAALRTMLKDTNPTCWAFSEDEIDMYLETSLWSFNAMPTFTNFSWSELEDRWLHIIVVGGLVWALYAQSLIEAGREFTITDSGIAFTPPPVSDKMQNYAGQMITFYKDQLNYIKANFKPSPSSVGVFTVLDISPSLRRLRFLRERRII